MTRMNTKRPLQVLGLTAGLVFASTTTSFATTAESTQAVQAAPLQSATTTASGTYGTSQWTFDNQGTLRFSAGTLPSGQISVALGLPKNDIKTIEFTDAAKTVLPADSSLMFSGLTSLETIVNPQNVDTSNVTNMTGLFQSSKISQLDLSSWDTSNVTNMSAAFMFSKATSLNIAGWDTSNVTNMTSMFHGTTALTTVDISDWDTSNVTNMQQMFFNASALQSLDIANWDTGKVTNMHQMFLSASALTELNIENWNTSNVTNMSSMFSSASALTELNIADWNTSNVTDMSSMFDGASSLTTLDLSGWDTSNVTDMMFMFRSASSLTTLDLSGWDTSNVTDTMYMFMNAPLEHLTLGADTVLSSDSGLRNLPENETLTGNWIEIGSNPATNPGLASWVGTTQALQERHSSAPASAGTYVAQQRATVTFDSNISGATGSMTDLAGATGEGLTLPADTFEHPSQSFVAWNTAADGSGQTYAPGDVFFPQAGASTLYAQWQDASEPTDPPVEPTDPPVEPTDPPVEPTNPPAGPGTLPSTGGTGSTTGGTGSTTNDDGVTTGGKGGSTNGKDSQLAQTGATVTGLALVSAALLGAGTWAFRRRRSQ